MEYLIDLQSILLCLVAMQYFTLIASFSRLTSAQRSIYCRDDFLDYKSTLKGHQLGVVSVTINAAGTVAASSSLDSTIRLWDLDSCKQIKSIGKNL